MTAGERPRRRLVAHPFLLAAYPVLFLFGRNAGEVPVGQVIGPLALVLGVTVAGMALMTLAVRDAQRAGLVTSVAVVATMGYGHVQAALPWSGGSAGRALLVTAWTGVAALLGWLALRAGHRTPGITTGVNTAATALVAMALLPVVPLLAGQDRSAEPSRMPLVEVADAGDQDTGRAAPRDIYYLVLDRYGAPESLRRALGVEVGPFVDGLEDRGLFVAAESRANYLKTAQSLASSLNMAYHHEVLAAAYGPGTSNHLPIYERISQHEVGRLLRERGYEYVHIGSWWDPTQGNPQADLDYGYADSSSDFSEALYETTLLAAGAQATGARNSWSDHRVRHFEAARAQFDGLRRADDLPGPTFVFAHLLLPHEPYVFDVDGSFVPEDVERARSREEGFQRQIDYLNSELEALLDEWLSRPEAQRPIVVLQGDEGTHPVRYTSTEGYDWGEAPTEDLKEKLRILNAYYLPGVEDPGLYDAITPVNTFRVIFNAYFGADLPLLPDETWVFRDTNHVYDYTEVTDRLE